MKGYTMTVDEAAEILGASKETIRRWTIQERIDWAVLDKANQNNITVIAPRFVAWLTASDYNLDIDKSLNALSNMEKISEGIDDILNHRK